MSLKSTLLPLAFFWLAAHVVLLAFLISLKFLTAKAVALVLVMGAGLLFLVSRSQRQLLLPPPDMI